MQVKLEYAASAVLGECPFWHFGEERLYWLDVEPGLLHRYDPQRQEDEVFSLGETVGCVVPIAPINAPGRTTELLIAAKSGVKRVLIQGIQDSDPTSVSLPYKTVFVIHPDAVPDNRYNDGKCSPEGRFWFGTINARREPKAALYSYGGRGGRGCGSNGAQMHVSDVRNSNGLAWSPDGNTFYWIDTSTMRVDAFDYDMEWGRISRRRAVLEFPQNHSLGKPDGMTIDADGNLWIAHWMGGLVSQWNPQNGKMLQKIAIPVKRCSSLTFGGPNLDVLYVTTSSRQGSNEPLVEPNAGGIFSLQPGVKGLPVAPFKTRGLDFC